MIGPKKTRAELEQEIRAAHTEQLVGALDKFAGQTAVQRAEGWTAPQALLEIDIEERVRQAAMAQFLESSSRTTPGQGLLSRYAVAQALNARQEAKEAERAAEREAITREMLSVPLSAISGEFPRAEVRSDPHLDGVHEIHSGIKAATLWTLHGLIPAPCEAELVPIPTSYQGPSLIMEHPALDETAVAHLFADNGTATN